MFHVAIDSFRPAEIILDIPWLAALATALSGLTPELERKCCAPPVVE